MKGGYYMIDCGGLDLTKGSTPQTIPGLYAACLKAFEINKPVYAFNLTWGLYGITPVQVFGVDFSAEDYVVFTASTLQFIVTKANSVTINNLAPEETPEG